jgi:acetyltransferase-like isoleucine patch superfamily enzyme
MSDNVSHLNNPFDRGYYTEHDLKNAGFAALGQNVRIGKNVTMVGLKNITIGSNVRIDDYSIIIASKGFLHLYDNVHIGGNSQLGCAGGITIKNFSGCSSGVRMFTQSDDYTGKWLTASVTFPPTVDVTKYAATTTGPIVLEKYVIIGANSVILPNVTLSEGVAVGSLSLVTKSLPPWGVYFGAPVKKIKNRSKHMVELEQQYLNDLNEQ